MSAKSILITGCSSGIGYDAAHGLTARGWRVFATCRDENDCARLRDEGLESFRLDYDDEPGITKALAEVLERTGGTLDALFNNGGYASPGALEDLPRAALRANFETNLFGYHDLAQQVIPVMRAQGHGRIINNSSVLGFTPMKWRGSYIATKHAMEGLTDTLRIEMRHTPIDIILIVPGPIKSRIRHNSVPHFKKWIDWENSVRAEEYQRELFERFQTKKKDFWELPASAVTKKLIHALESPRPNPRYFVTTPTYTMEFLRRFLSTRARDWLIARG